MQLQQSHLQRESFLDVGVQQALGGLHDLQVIDGFGGRDSAGDLGGAGEIGKVQASGFGGERVQPDVAEPALDEAEQIRALTPVFGLDGGGEFVLPFVAQILFDVLLALQRRARGQAGIDGRLHFGELLEQDIHEPIAGDKALLFGRGDVAETGEP